MGKPNSKHSRVNKPNEPPTSGSSANASHKDSNVIEFAPEQSHAICIAMDIVERPLGPLATSGCKALAKALSDYLHIPPANVKQLLSSEDPGLLFTRDGLLPLLIDCARSVGPEGILIIVFSGHGTTVVKDGTKQAALPLLGHTTENPKYLDANDIVEAVQTKAKFRGKNVLLVLDCCFSGGIAEWLQSDERGDNVFHTIAACSPYQTTIQLDPLGVSQFTYFMIEALRESCHVQQEETSGPMARLCPQDIFTHICDSSWALSAMYIKYNIASQSLQGCMIEEENGVESTDGTESVDGERFLIFLKYWKVFSILSEQPSLQSSEKWLRAQAKPNGPLTMLTDCGHLMGKDLQATICILSKSVAAIHLYEKHPCNGRARLFLIDFTKIISAIEVAIFSARGEKVIVQHKDVRQALTYYFAVYKNAEWVDLSELRLLYRMLCADEVELAHKGEDPDALVSEE